MSKENETKNSVFLYKIQDNVLSVIRLPFGGESDGTLTVGAGYELVRTSEDVVNEAVKSLLESNGYGNLDERVVDPLKRNIAKEYRSQIRNAPAFKNLDIEIVIPQPKSSKPRGFAKKTNGEAEVHSQEAF